MNSQKVIADLLYLYRFQTPGERQIHETAEKNGEGFNSFDAGFLTNISKQVLTKKQLTMSQIEVVEKALVKYKRQLASNPADKPPFNVSIIDNGEKASTIASRKAEVRNGMFVIKFNYYAALVVAIKEHLDGRRWNPIQKIWTAPATQKNADWLRSMGFELLGFVDSDVEENESRSIPMQGLAIPSFVNNALFHYQKEGVEFVQAKEGRAIIADEMGLGKTIQVIAWLLANPQARPAVVICPASLKLNWEREWIKWGGSAKELSIVFGREPIRTLKSVVIINYDLMDAWLGRLVDHKPMAVIMDECHYAKNSKAKRTKAVRQLAKGISHIIALSGTPILNKPVEFFPILNMIVPKTFPNFFLFAKRYCGGKSTRWGWDFSGASNTEELNKILSKTCMIRRLKKDVMKELPPKIRSIIPLSVEVDKYESIMEQLRDWLRSNPDNPAEAMVKIEYAKQAVAQGKISAAVEWIKDYLEDDGKLVVFATHHEIINQLALGLLDYNPVIVTGQTSIPERQAAVDAFQSESTCKILIGNIKAAGVGLTLTAASATAFVEFGWTPGEHQQAEDRVHRIGQEADSVNAYYLVAAGTIDEDIAQRIDSKARVLAAVLDGTKLSKDDGSLLTELIKDLKK